MGPDMSLFACLEQGMSAADDTRILLQEVPVASQISLDLARGSANPRPEGGEGR